MNAKYVPVICIVLLSITWVISSCAAPVPTLTPGSILASVRDLACESVIDSDLEKAYDNPVYKNGDVYWSFHMNFRAFDSNGHPLACFRLYGRDNLTKRFIDIDDGGKLVNTCQTVGSVQYSTSILAHSSHGPTASGGVDVPTGQASFEGNGHIECQIDIGQLAVESVVTDLHSLKLTQADVEMINANLEKLINQQIQEYETFTIVAAGAVQWADNSANPVVYYRPHSIPSPSIGMLLPTFKNAELGTFYATLEKLNPVYSPLDSVPDSVISVEDLPPVDLAPECYHSHSTQTYWWINFDTSQTQKGWDTLTFAKRLIAPSFPPEEFCIKLTPAPTPAKLQFWTGPAILYIGCQPDSDGNCESRLFGDLFGVLLDPVDSKTQAD